MGLKQKARIYHSGAIENQEGYKMKERLIILAIFMWNSCLCQPKQQIQSISLQKDQDNPKYIQASNLILTIADFSANCLIFQKQSYQTLTSEDRWAHSCLLYCVVQDYNIMKTKSKDIICLTTFILLLGLVVQGCTSPLMIQEKEEFLQKLRTKNIAVLFYGDNQSPEYQSFQQLIPSTYQLFDGIQFVYVPASKFKLNRPSPSLSIYRKIGGGDWQLYKGNFDKADMDKWIQHNIMDPLKELTIENLEKMFRESHPGFILLSYGQFELIRTKIYVNQFCNFKNIKCWKVQPASPIYSVVTKLMGIQKEDFGESKLAFYSPQSERLQLYTRDIWKLRRQQLLEMYEGRQGIVHSETPEGQLQIELHYEEQQQI